MSRISRIEYTQPAAIVIAGILLALLVIFTNTHRPGTGAFGQLPANVHVRPPSANDHIVGSLNTPIVLIEYTDLQCPYCSSLYPILQGIVSTSNGKIAWVVRNFPLYQLHPEAEAAANAAECITEQAGNAGFWKFADDAFKDQDLLGTSFYAQEAQGLGINMDQYNVCVSIKKYQSRIDADLQEAVSNGGIGTPFTVVYGHGKEIPISGALPYPQFISVIKGVEGQ